MIKLQEGRNTNRKPAKLNRLELSPMSYVVMLGTWIPSQSQRNSLTDLRAECDRS